MKISLTAAILFPIIIWVILKVLLSNPVYSCYKNKLKTFEQFTFENKYNIPNSNLDLINYELL